MQRHATTEDSLCRLIPRQPSSSNVRSQENPDTVRCELRVEWTDLGPNLKKNQWNWCPIVLQFGFGSSWIAVSKSPICSTSRECWVDRFLRENLFDRSWNLIWMLMVNHSLALCRGFCVPTAYPVKHDLHRHSSRDYTRIKAGFCADTVWSFQFSQIEAWLSALLWL